MNKFFEDDMSRLGAQRRLPQLTMRLLGWPPATRVARLANRRRLPVLAYHDITDAALFARHLDLIQEHHHPVAGEEVITAIRGGRRLPRGAIWVTFDDANPGVFALGMSLLKERGVPASLFVCPGVIDTCRPYWWQVIDTALATGRSIAVGGKVWSDRSIITHLKQVPDDVRRALVARTADEIAESGKSVAVRQATSTALRQWLDAGLELGNHTWDHPCLNTCDEKEQHRQIIAAHEWLRDKLGVQPRLFAYPNGNVAGPSRRILDKVGYQVVVLFDHRVSRADGPEVSRLRIDAHAPIERLDAIASGLHPAVYALAQRFGTARDTPGAKS